MIRIRNARQYREALDRAKELETRREFATLTHKEMSEMLNLGEALDTYELAHAEPRQR
jgi:hypothetical protein